MQTKFVLDFDGVLFNSAFEAFTVANLATEGKPGFRQDVSYDEFLAFRRVVTDAWQYNRLYSASHALPPSAIRKFEPEEIDWAFADDFFAARKVVMAEADWPKVMPAYDFFLLLKPMLVQNPGHFVILSTRNIQSIRETLAFHGTDIVPVFGQEDIRKHGSKLGVAQSQQWLDRGRYLVTYIDDMTSHLEPFEGRIHLPLHANWGYDHGTPRSLSANQIHTIISSLMTVAQKEFA